MRIHQEYSLDDKTAQSSRPPISTLVISRATLGMTGPRGRP